MADRYGFPFPNTPPFPSAPYPPAPGNPHIVPPIYPPTTLPPPLPAQPPTFPPHLPPSHFPRLPAQPPSFPPPPPPSHTNPPHLPPPHSTPPHFPPHNPPQFPPHNPPQFPPHNPPQFPPQNPPSFPHRPHFPPHRPPHRPPPPGRPPHHHPGPPHYPPSSGHFPSPRGGPGNFAYFWADTSAARGIPPTSVHGGVDIDGTQIYVGRAFHEGDWIPAKVIPEKGVAYVAYDGKEIAVFNFQVLCEQRFDWIQTFGGNVPPNAVEGGRTSDGETLYIGRVFHEGSNTVGKVHPSHGSLYIPFNGEEVAYQSYEILVLR